MPQHLLLFGGHNLVTIATALRLFFAMSTSTTGGLYYIGGPDDVSEFLYITSGVQHTPPPYPCLTLWPPEKPGKPHTGWNMASESVELSPNLQESATMLMSDQDNVKPSSKVADLQWRHTFNTLYVSQSLWSGLADEKRDGLKSLVFLKRAHKEYSARIVICDVPSSHYD